MKRAAADLRERLRGLKPAQADQLRRAMQLLQAGDMMMAGQLLLDLARSAPDHAEVLRGSGLLHMAVGEWPRAVACLSRASAMRPADFSLLLQLATAQDHAGDFAAAPISLRAAVGCARVGQEWLALSLEFDRQGYVDEAFATIDRAINLGPTPASGVALLQRARCAMALGKAELAAADCRALIARGELLARAWFMLADLKVLRLSDADVEQLQSTAARPPAGTTAEERLYLQFALGKALEDAGKLDGAFVTLCQANDSAAATRPWDRAAFQRQMDAIAAACEAASPPPVAGQGGEVIFLVGLPRSGTTLIEQVLASHSQVEGASELPYLGFVIEAESQRRGMRFPHWIPSTSEADWARMGQAYLAHSARWRASRPIATDKLPENWVFAGAALRMLPGARFIDCRRDPVETCWSCYKQLFGPGMVHFTYSFEGLAAYWAAYDKLSRIWAARHPGRFFVQRYEALVADPETQIRALLQACGLPFEPGCLSSHSTPRAIRTPSALQVRQPMRKASTPAARYGALMDPLRQSLAAA